MFKKMCMGVLIATFLNAEPNNSAEIVFAKGCATAMSPLHKSPGIRHE